MESQPVTMSTSELRAIIRFFPLKEKNGTDIHNELTSIYGEQCILRASDQLLSGNTQISSGKVVSFCMTMRVPIRFVKLDDSSILSTGMS